MATFTLHLDNFDEPTEYKLLYYETTWATSAFLGPDMCVLRTIIPPSSADFDIEGVTGGYEELGNDIWRTYGSVKITPNPPYEDIQIGFGHCGGSEYVWIDDMHIATVCTGTHGAVPISSAVWLLGSGLVGIVGIRRKFKT